MVQPEASQISCDTAVLGEFYLRFKVTYQLGYLLETRYIRWVCWIHSSTKWQHSQKQPWALEHDWLSWGGAKHARALVIWAFGLLEYPWKRRKTHAYYISSAAMATKWKMLPCLTELESWPARGSKKEAGNKAACPPSFSGKGIGGNFYHVFLFIDAHLVRTTVALKSTGEASTVWFVC